MTDFSRRVESISISGIREAFESAGEDAINLGLGQPDFPAPEHVHDAAVEAIRDGAVDGYTENLGRRSLREAIADHHAEHTDLAIDPEGVIATAGGSEALHVVLESHVDPGEEVLFPDPGFVSYDALTRVAGGEPRGLPLRDDLTLDPATVEDAITEETAVFVVNSPANPTGAVQTPADMEAFARIADEYDVLCLSDEVYGRIVFDGEHRSPAAFAETDSVVVVDAVSKTYSMTGWRLGWIAASPRRTELMVRVHQYAQACATAASQHAAEAALTGPQGRVTEMVAAFEDRRDLLYDGLREMGLDVPEPRGAFYMMPAVPDGWVEAVLERDVVVVPGEAFGAHGAGHARLSYATSETELDAALEVMREATAAVR